MNKEGRPEGAAHHLTEAQRAQDFKHERTSLINAARTLCSVSSPDEFQLPVDITHTTTSYGSEQKVTIKDELNNEPRQRTLVFRPVQAANEEYLSARHDEIIASYEEETTHKDFAGAEHKSRKGWEVCGDGSVRRFVLQEDEAGIWRGVNRGTNDTLDLIEANEQMLELMVEVLPPTEQQA